MEQYSDTILTPVDAPVLLGLAQETFERNQWIINGRDENGLGGTTAELFPIWIKIRTTGVEVFSEGTNPDECLKVIAVFTTKFNFELKSLTPERKSELSAKVGDIFGEESLPGKLSPPRTFREPSPVYLIPITLLVAIVCGLAMSILMQYGFIVVGICIVLVGVILGSAAASSSKRGNYTNIYVQGIAISFSAVVFFITAIVLAYSGLPDRFSFANIMEAIGKQMETNQRLSQFIWIMMVLFPSLFAIEICKRKNAQFIVDRVPKDVRAFIQDLHVNGADAATIRNELRTKGWTEIRDQDYALESFYNQATLKSLTKA